MSYTTFNPTWMSSKAYCDVLRQSMFSNMPYAEDLVAAGRVVYPVKL